MWGEEEGSHRYREKECDDCNRLFPANELREVTVDRKSGHSMDGSTFLGRSKSTRVRYDTRYIRVTYLVCSGCPDPKSEGGFSRVLIISLIVAGGGGALLWPVLSNLQDIAALPPPKPATERIAQSGIGEADDYTQEEPESRTLSELPSEPPSPQVAGVPPPPPPPRKGNPPLCTATLQDGCMNPSEAPPGYRPGQ